MMAERVVHAYPFLERLWESAKNGITAKADKDILHGTSVYTDPDWHKLEMDFLFERTPIVVGLSNEIVKPGDFVTKNVMGFPLVIIRGDNGGLFVHLNACPHRGNLICSERSGNTETFVCAYHNWSYDLEGRVKFCGSNRVPWDLPEKKKSLVTVLSFERFGLIWACPWNRDSNFDIKNFIPCDLIDEMSENQDVGNVLFRSDSRFGYFNWKLGIEAFLETDHFGSVHKETIAPTFLHGLIDFEKLGIHHRISVPKRTILKVRDMRSERRPHSHAMLVYFLFPNTLYMRQVDHVIILRFLPDRFNPGKCTIETDMLVPSRYTSSRAFAHCERTWNAVRQIIYEEDLKNVGKVQKNIECGAIDDFIFNRTEIAVQTFHEDLRRQLDRLANR